MDKAMVAVIRCPDYRPDHVYECIKKGVDLLGGIHKYFKKDEKILVKLNLLSTKELVATHPVVFEAVLRLLLENDIKACYGDSPGFLSPKTVSEETEFSHIAARHGIVFADFENGRTVNYSGYWRNHQFPVVNAVFEADGIVSLPKMKTHQLTRITGAIKNQFGCIVGQNKLRFHYSYSRQNDFNKMLIDLNLHIRPRLFILDGIVAMEGNGPSNGNPVQMNVLLVSDDPVALDATFSRLINLEPKYLPFLVYGKKAKLGTYLENEIIYLGDDYRELVNRQFQVQRRKKIKNGDRENIPLLGWIFYSRPMIQKDNCIFCGKCIAACPVPEKAIYMKNNRIPPFFNYNTCIKCYCCQEACPNNAIVRHKAVLGS